MTISPNYLAQQKKLHENPQYGTASNLYAPYVSQVLAPFAGTASLSDYGAGKKNLYKALTHLGVKLSDYFPYDPAFPEYGAPQSADLVCCIDVLEHIEPEFLEDVLLQLSKITKKFGFFSISTCPAIKILSDGRNAHLIQKPSSFWLSKLVKYFEIAHLETVEDGAASFFVLVTPKNLI